MLLLSIALQAAMPAPAAASVSAQGLEVIDLFSNLCVEQSSFPLRARHLNGQPTIARPMTVGELAKVFPGAAATEGWIVTTPHDAVAAVWFAPSKRTCGVSVRAAEPAGLEQTLNDRLRKFFLGLGHRLAQRPDEKLVEGGVAARRAKWTSEGGGRGIAVIATFRDQPVGGEQHLMTFTMLR